MSGNMQIGTVIHYSDVADHPHAEVALRNGDHVQITLDRAGLTIKQPTGLMQPSKVLFRANPNLTSRICAGLFGLETTPSPTPLRILVAALVQLGSAEEVGNAFQEAATHVP
jgi:hypothetical protein